MDIRVAADGKGRKTFFCCFIMPPRPILMYATRKIPVPETVAEDLESKHKGARKIQQALDVHMAVDLWVQEAMQEEESQWQKKEQEAARKAEAEEAARVKAEEIAR